LGVENLILHIVPKLSSFSFVMLFLISKNVLVEFLRSFKFPINGIIPFEIRVKLLPFSRQQFIPISKCWLYLQNVP
jgi:hypothetical protein